MSSDAAAKPDAPTELGGRRWLRLGKRTGAHVLSNGLIDGAAALTYYAMLSLFPGLIVLTSLLGLFGRAGTTTALLDIVGDIGPQSAVDTFRGPIEGIVERRGTAGVLLIVGLVGAVWSASGYTSAFGRYANQIWEVEEGRSIWRRKPLELAITVVVVLMVAVLVVAIVLTGPLAQAVGAAIGLGDAAVLTWQIAKWPVMLAIVIGIVALLYYATPNVRQRGLRWIGPGAAVAVLTWIVVSLAFGFYVANFGSYDATYGSLGAVIVFLVWLWLTNLALLFGAQLNAEIERERELAAGRPAEEQIQLPPRDPKD